jgi:lysophospholipase L1-like esterase
VAFLIDPRFLELTDAFNAIVATTAAAHRVRVGDVFAAFNGPPQPATICALTFACSSGDSHPSDEGYRVIAEQLWQVSGYDELED